MNEKPWSSTILEYGDVEVLFRELSLKGSYQILFSYGPLRFPWSEHFLKRDELRPGSQEKISHILA